MQRDEILNILGKFKRDHAERYGILKLGIFGSTARGEAGIDSDVDICIITASPNPFNLVHIKEDIEGLIRKRVDIVRVRDKMNPYLLERIEKEGRYV
jgi:predicted nucleotidyltransferase